MSANPDGIQQALWRELLGDLKFDLAVEGLKGDIGAFQKLPDAKRQEAETVRWAGSELILDIDELRVKKQAAADAIGSQVLGMKARLRNYKVDVPWSGECDWYSDGVQVWLEKSAWLLKVTVWLQVYVVPR